MDAAALPGIDAFLCELADRHAAGTRLGAVARRRSGRSACCSYAAIRRPTRPHASFFSRVPDARRRRWSSSIVSEKENIEDHLTYLSERAETPEESELSFRLLRHYASSVRHRQYHGIEIVTVKVAGSR